MASSLDGSATWAWGAGHYGQLGVGGTDPVLAPARVGELDGKRVVGVDCGANHSGAVCADGNMFMWGNPSNARLGLEIEQADTPKVTPEAEASPLE